MKHQLRLLAFSLTMIGCGDDDSSGLEDANAFTLSESQQLEFCQRTEADRKQTVQAFSIVACTEAAHDENDCSAARAACIAKIQPVDFDSCASSEAMQRLQDVFRANLSVDPSLSELVDEIDMEGMTLPTAMPGCEVKVRGWIACLHANAGAAQKIADGYSCDGGDELLDFPPPDACVQFSRQASACIEAQ